MRDLDRLLDKAKTLPKKPGCYLMRRSDGDVIYVGKAKDLRARVSSYFNNSAKSPKTEVLVSHIRDFDFQMTENEVEAFVLENNLIKKHRPKYNIQMRDDRSYPYVVINHNEPYPRLEYQRRPKRGKGLEVFGPFVVGSNISEVLRILTKSFALRDCNLREFKSRTEPCLLYQMKQCSAPCVDKISKADYDNDLQLAMNFFTGKEQTSLKILRASMEEAAAEEAFERAAILRDAIEVLEQFIDFSQQNIAELHDKKDRNIDVLGYFAGREEIEISLYMVRNGFLLGHKTFHFARLDINEDVEEEVLSFMFQYYRDTYDAHPDKVILPFEKEQIELFKEGIASLDLKTKVQAPARKYSKISELTQDHAAETQRVRIANKGSVFVGLDRLKELLQLPERPRILECYDVAIWQGKSPTAAQIVFVDGRADRNRYRHYHLEEREEGNNDFAMMREIISRRLKHGSLPDVFIVDGGKGQVSSFKAVLDENEIEIPVVGIAKSKSKFTKNKDSEKGEERLILPNRSNPYLLSKNRSLFQIIVQMRDEAHRFSRRLHHKQEKRRLFGKKNTN